MEHLNSGNFAVGTIAGVVAFATIVATVGVNSYSASSRYWEGYRACVASGGTWIPTGDIKAVCIQRQP